MMIDNTSPVDYCNIYNGGVNIISLLLILPLPLPPVSRLPYSVLRWSSGEHVRRTHAGKTNWFDRTFFNTFGVPSPPVSPAQTC